MVCAYFTNDLCQLWIVDAHESFSSRRRLATQRSEKDPERAGGWVRPPDPPRAGDGRGTRAAQAEGGGGGRAAAAAGAGAIGLDWWGGGNGPQ